MKPPIFVREPSEGEHEALEAGLRSKDAFVLRRCQILLASARGQSPPRIAKSLGCGSQTVRNTIHAFDERGLDALVAGSSRPKRTHAAFERRSAEALKEMLHHSPREFGKGNEPVDARGRRRGEFRAGTEREAGFGGDDPGDSSAARGALAAGQAVDHEPRP